MIVCRDCGYRNEDGASFCGGCPGYLPHTGERVPDEPATADEAVSEPVIEDTQPQSTFIHRVRSMVGREGAALADGPPETEDATADDAAVREARAAEQQVQEAAAALEEARRVEAQARQEADAAGSSDHDADAEHDPADHADGDGERAATGAGAEAEAAQQEREQAEREAARAEERARRAAALVAKPTARSDSPAASPPHAADTGTDAQAAPPGSEAQPRVEARKPSAPAPGATARPTTRQPPSRRIDPGDLICGQCGEPNNPDRHFCSRCAHPLSDAEVARARWYRRLLARRSARRNKTAKAGERPGRGGAKGTGLKARKRKVAKVGRGVLRWAQALIVLGALVVGIGVVGPWREPVLEWFGERWTQVRRMVVPEYDLVNPTAASASSELPDHPAQQTIDGFDNTHWLGAGSEQQVLTIEFDEPVDIDQLGVSSGASGDAFLDHSRPRELHVVFDDASTTTIELADEPEFQTFPTEATGVTDVQLHIESVYASVESDDVSITLLRFFTRLR